MGKAEKIIAQIHQKCNRILGAMIAEEKESLQGNLIYLNVKGHSYCYLQYKDAEHKKCRKRILETEILEVKEKIKRRESLKKDIKLLQKYIVCIEKEFPQITLETKPDDKDTNATSEKPYATLKGDYVRSKSEAIIANELYMGQISYEYEKKLLLPGHAHEFLPDFTICTPKKKKTIYWEHCGLIANEEYRIKWNRKKQVYEDNGISEWHKNLIVSYESQVEPLDITKIHQHIDWLAKQ